MSTPLQLIQKKFEYKFCKYGNACTNKTCTFMHILWRKPPFHGEKRIVSGRVYIMQNFTMKMRSNQKLLIDNPENAIAGMFSLMEGFLRIALNVCKVGRINSSQMCNIAQMTNYPELSTIGKGLETVRTFRNVIVTHVTLGKRVDYVKLIQNAERLNSLSALAWTFLQDKLSSEKLFGRILRFTTYKENFEKKQKPLMDLLEGKIIDMKQGGKTYKKDDDDDSYSLLKALKSSRYNLNLSPSHETEPGSDHSSLFFHCGICGALVISGKDVNKIQSNSVWSNENSKVGCQEQVNSDFINHFPKDIGTSKRCVKVRCLSCGSMLGYNYYVKPKVKMTKLTYIHSGSGRNFMFCFGDNKNKKFGKPISLHPSKRFAEKVKMVKVKENLAIVKLMKPKLMKYLKSLSLGDQVVEIEKWTRCEALNTTLLKYFEVKSFMAKEKKDNTD